MGEGDPPGLGRVDAGAGRLSLALWGRYGVLLKCRVDHREGDCWNTRRTCVFSVRVPVCRGKSWCDSAGALPLGGPELRATKRERRE